jgi:hypothetical protein
MYLVSGVINGIITKKRQGRAMGVLKLLKGIENR